MTSGANNRMWNNDVYSFIFFLWPLSHSVIGTYLFCGLRKVRLNPALNRFGCVIKCYKENTFSQKKTKNYVTTIVSEQGTRGNY